MRPGRGSAQRTAILSVLGRIELGAAEELAPALEQEKEDLAWGSLVVVVTAAVTEPLVAAMLKLRAAGFEVRAVLAGRSGRPAPNVGALEAFGVGADRIALEADIRGLAL